MHISLCLFSLFSTYAQFLTPLMIPLPIMCVLVKFKQHNYGS